VDNKAVTIRVSRYICFRKHFYTYNPAEHFIFDMVIQLVRISDNLHLPWCFVLVMAFYESFKNKAVFKMWWGEAILNHSLTVMWAPKWIMTSVYDFIIPTFGIYNILFICNGNMVPWVAVQYNAPSAFLLDLFTFLKDKTYYMSKH
jgi:hypothetical protein